MARPTGTRSAEEQIQCGRCRKYIDSNRMQQHIDLAHTALRERSSEAGIKSHRKIVKVNQSWLRIGR